MRIKIFADNYIKVLGPLKGFYAPGNTLMFLKIRQGQLYSQVALQ